jgi:hypothetical protein
VELALALQLKLATSIDEPITGLEAATTSTSTGFAFNAVTSACPVAANTHAIPIDLHVCTLPLVNFQHLNCFDYPLIEFFLLSLRHPTWLFWKNT